MKRWDCMIIFDNDIAGRNCARAELFMYLFDLHKKMISLKVLRMFPLNKAVQFGKEFHYFTISLFHYFTMCL